MTDETPQEEEEEEDGLSFVIATAPVVWGMGASLCRLRYGIRQRMCIASTCIFFVEL